MKARQLAGSSEEFKAFTADMDEAVKAMGPAAEKLRGSQWDNALAPEQKALQHLLRAEAAMRDIKVAFGNSGGGGGGKNGADRDLQSLFDLELDTEKNQYESGQSAASKDQRQKEIDEALQKLEQLARRQQELAEQQRRNQQVSQQRWQQEMLRREAEELQRKMEQLSRNQQGQQQQGQPQSGQPQSGQPQSGQSGKPSSQGGQMSSQQLQRAIQQLKQAQQDMRQSTSSQSESDSRRAAERLKEARDMLAGMRQQQAAGSVDDLAREAESLANRQQESNSKMRKAFGAPGQEQAQGASRQQAEELAREKEQLANDYQKLESEMEKAAREVQAGNRQLSSKLRDALGQVQQNEINNRLRLSADWLRTGRGPQATMRDAVTTQALNTLRDQLRDIQKSAGEGQQGAGDKDRQALEQALAETERLRKEMERTMQTAHPSRYRQGAVPQPVQHPGGQPGEQPGQQPGQQQGNLQNPQPGEGQPGGQIGPRSNGPQYGLAAKRASGLLGTPGDFLRDYRHTLRELEGNPQIGKDLRDRIHDLYRLDPQLSPGNAHLMDLIQSQMLTGIEQIELQLRRQLDDQGGAVRSGSAEPVPQGYADAVAEYFRRLSKEK